MKMNLSMSGGFLKPVTGFFKKYTALLPSIAITLAAILLFIPTLLVGKSVKKQMEGSVRTAGTVASLLQRVPSKSTPQQVKRYMDRFEEETKQIETMAVESSMRELLSYNVLPKPKDTSQQLYVNFGNKYRAAVEKLITTLNASDAPSENEINSQTGTGNQRERGYGQTVVSAANPMVEAICLKRSQEISTYAYPSVFPWYDFWERYNFAGQGQALEDCWDTQVSFWIFEDVAETIRKMNDGSKTVSTSPVKRLLGISFSGSVTVESAVYASYGARDPGAGRLGETGVRDKPNYILSPSAVAADQVRTAAGAGERVSNFMFASPTGRTGNEDVDVIHFAFSVLVDNRAVMTFLKELCSEKSHRYRTDFKEDGPEKNATHNEITILKHEISVVDKQDSIHEFYRYGEGAVMRLDLVCEYQFVRKGYDGIKPESVKAALGQAVAAEGQNTMDSGMPTGPDEFLRR